MPSVSAETAGVEEMTQNGEMTDPGVATRQLPVGLSTRVRVPASSANLGPGFDCLGIALGIYDEVIVETVEAGVVLDVEGEGSADVPRDESHLVVRALNHGLAHAGVSAPGLKLRCINQIPHSRGLGSSAAAAVSGLAAASGLISAAGFGVGLSTDELVQLSSEFEGHPDNAAASVLGSAVVTWTDTADEVNSYHAHRLSVHPDVCATVFVPDTESSTSFTRGLLPDAVPRADAVFNLSRAALAVVALASDPRNLMAASADRLHQPYRASAMVPTSDLVAELRARGHAATVSGAGPTVLVLGTAPIPADIRVLAQGLGFTTHSVAIAGGVDISAG
ncbi:homoserine kinase [Gordonia amicalis]|uniref:homoserine kinase n=1 Tax=Gordonia amicalis TaxID=89053 RepID=UPI0002A62522|nr:homoserine kinase [Gordonia amicalis]MBA5847135.1 homoserine kinase [Gordonia amicalis]MDV7175108.1 homoserine kinase [Gordonia amicalis]NKX79230.1 homoserine kinase [Gordonia amicalis]UOG21592.1 homoserine kinase [Gordonia amicalis]GAC54217.1 homoserine kinase [Gordonia amicalis NBRC 100051 = JCM 11271]